MGTRAGADRGLPETEKLALLLLLLLEAIWTALGRTWLKMVTVRTGGMVGRWGDGRNKPVPGEKPVLKAWVAPRRKVCQVEGTEQVLPTALAILMTPKLKAGFKVESVGALVRLVDMTTEVALTRPWKRWEEAGGNGAEGCLVGKGAGTGRVLSGATAPRKMGLKVGVVVPGAVQRKGLGKAAAGAALELMASPLPISCWGSHLGFSTM